MSAAATQQQLGKWYCCICPASGRALNPESAAESHRRYAHGCDICGGTRGADESCSYCEYVIWPQGRDPR